MIVKKKNKTVLFFFVTICIISWATTHTTKYMEKSYVPH